MFQRLFFVFGVFMLLALSFSIKKQTWYHNKLLGIFIISSFLTCLFHSMALKAPSVVYNYIVFTYMVEGFVYLFAGAILYWLVVNYSDKFNILYPLIAINILNLFFAITQIMNVPLIYTRVPTICGLMGTKSQLALFSAMSIPILFNFRIKDIWYPIFLIPLACLILSGSFTAWFALLLTMLIYFKKTKQIERFWIAILIAMPFIWINHKAIWLKFTIRLEAWWITLKEIWQSPFIGNGFDNGLTMNTVYSKIDAGMAYRHCDILNFTRDSGLPIALLLVCMIYKTYKKVRFDEYWFACTVLLIGSCFQTSMYFARIGVIAIIMFALMEKRKCTPTDIAVNV